MVSFSAHTTHCPVVESPRLLILYIYGTARHHLFVGLLMLDRNRDGYYVLLPVLTLAGEYYC